VTAINGRDPRLAFASVTNRTVAKIDAPSVGRPEEMMRFGRGFAEAIGGSTGSFGV